MGKYSKKESFDKTKLLVILLLFITATAVCVTVWALFFRIPETTLAPDYAPQETEAHAETIPNDNSRRKESEKGGGSVSLTYSNQLAIDLSDERVSLLFANPNKSNQDMVLQIVIQDQVVVQSGRIGPGHQIKTLDLMDGAASRLSPGGYDGKFVVLYYHPDSGEKAIVNTEIPVHIEVRN